MKMMRNELTFPNPKPSEIDNDKQIIMFNFFLHNNNIPSICFWRASHHSFMDFTRIFLDFFYIDFPIFGGLNESS